MKAKLISRRVGPYSMNTYAVLDERKKTSAIIDPGGEPDVIMDMVAGYHVVMILITHGHSDHISDLETIRQNTKAPVYIHPSDGNLYGVSDFEPLFDGQRLSIGDLRVKVIHVPGHTPGQCCFDLGDGRILVGDAIFVGGPGRTASPDDFKTTMESMKNIVFKWADQTTFYPGHGPFGTIGQERPAFENFVHLGWTPRTHGDITWDKKQ